MRKNGSIVRGAFAVLSLLAIAGSPSWAYRESFTEEQRTRLAGIQTIDVEALALTEKGAMPPEAIREVVMRRLSELGYTVEADPARPHDVLVRVKCEQQKTFEGTAATGGDNDLPDAPSRLWKGPACRLTYELGGMKIQWQKEVRAELADAAAAASAQGGESGETAMTALREALATSDFPLWLAAEWGQSDRLLKVLDAPTTSQIRKLKIISLLGAMSADEALPHLREALKDHSLAQDATAALGNMGQDGIPILVDILKHAKQPALQAAAAKGLGDLGNIHSDPRVVPPLLEMLDAPGIDIAVQTEIAWALGRVPDRRSVEPLQALDRKLQKIRHDPPDPAIKKLKEAVFWSIKQVYTEDQYS